LCGETAARGRAWLTKSIDLGRDLWDLFQSPFAFGGATVRGGVLLAGAATADQPFVAALVGVAGAAFFSEAVFLCAAIGGWVRRTAGREAQGHQGEKKEKRKEGE